MANDVRNLDMNGVDSNGAARYESVLEKMFSFLPEAMDELDDLITRYPDFILGHIFKAYILAADGRRSTLKDISKRVNDIEHLAGTPNLREKLHLDALKQWSENNLKAAIDTWQLILSMWPQDILAYRQFQGQIFWFGQKARALNLSAQLLPHWNEDTPGYWMFSSMHGFALEEMGHYDLAEHFARQALADNSRDLAAKHTLAHLYEMQGRTQDGIHFLENQTSSLNQHNAFRGHLWWHLALFFFEQGDVDQALALFDKEIYSVPSANYLDIQNGASLLIRLDFLGIDVGERWSKLVQGVTEIAGDSSIMFTELHNAMVIANNPLNSNFNGHIDKVAASPLIRQESEFSIATQIMEAIAAYHSKQYQHAANLITAVKELHYQLGGSHAQQDVLSQYLIMAHANLNQWPQVVSLLKLRFMSRADHGSLTEIQSKLSQIEQVKSIDALLPHLAKVE